jgi:hypothetical protein
MTARAQAGYGKGRTFKVAEVDLNPVPTAEHEEPVVQKLKGPQRSYRPVTVGKEA